MSVLCNVYGFLKAPHMAIVQDQKSIEHTMISMYLLFNICFFRLQGQKQDFTLFLSYHLGFYPIPMLPTFFLQRPH